MIDHEPSDAPAASDRTKDPLDWTITQGVNPRSTVEVDPGDGSGVPQRWAGATWNDHVDRARRSGEEPTARVIEVDPPPAWERPAAATVEEARAAVDALQTRGAASHPAPAWADESTTDSARDEDRDTQ
jgi:hypothetical protein